MKWLPLFLVFFACNETPPKKIQITDKKEMLKDSSIQSIRSSNDVLTNRMNQGFLVYKFSTPYTSPKDYKLYSKISLMPSCECVNNGRDCYGLLSNVKAVIVKKYAFNLIQTGNIKLFPFNMPKFVAQIKDTFLVTGLIYEIGATEGSQGFPFVLLEVRTKKN